MRFDIDSAREIVDTLTRNKSRSLLTGFGIFWGLFMLLFLIGGGQGLKTMLSRNFEGFATNSMLVVSSQTSKPYKGLKEGRYWNLNMKDVDRLMLMVPELEVVTPIISRWGETATRGSRTSSCSLKGVSPDYARVEEPKLRYGRYINDVDVRMDRKVCVIGKRIYEGIFPEGGDPCGQFIKVGNIFYQVVGVDFNAGNISINGRTDQTVSIPMGVAQTVYRRGSNVDILCMTGRSGVKMSELEGRVRSIIAREHMVDQTDDKAMFVINTEQMFSLIDNLFRGVNFLVWLVGLGTLLAGAIGVSNIMMVTVKERTVEIGIRRAIGATPSDVLSQIILESVLLTVISGMGAIMFSVMLLSLLEMITGGQAAFQISFTTAMLAAMLLTVLGIAAGMAPASRAMAIKPVDAMRDE